MAGIWLTALDSIASDLLGQSGDDDGIATRFFCGNFGLILLDLAQGGKVKKVIETMLRVTMARGAQSAGLVTYSPSGRGIRHRVCNGKRTDLCTLLLRKYNNLLSPRRLSAPQIFQGHTRFATSSIANLEGCHPHQWCPPSQGVEWQCDPATCLWKRQVKNIETFITHNGDIDFFTFHDVSYPQEDVQRLLARLLHAPSPAAVDSACVAGLLDLLRAKGMWLASVRYGYAYGALATAGGLGEQLDMLWGRQALERAAALFESEWATLVLERQPESQAASFSKRPDSSTTSPTLTITVDDAERGAAVATSAASMRAAMVQRMLARLDEQPALFDFSAAQPCVADNARALIASAVGAFFEQDLLAAARQLLGNAIGSFGLVLSTSLDAQNELIIAARGQTMSVAFYPLLGAVLFGSESAATKAGLGLAAAEAGVAGTSSCVSKADPLAGGFRFDLDDVNGEVVQLRWGASPPATASADSAPNSPRSPSSPNVSTSPGSPNSPVSAGSPGRKLARRNTRRMQTAVEVMPFRGGHLYVNNYLENRFADHRPFMKRILRLGGNPLVSPLPPMGTADPVGKDLADLCSVLEQIRSDWNEPSESLNRLSAFTLQARLRARMLAHDVGTHDGSIDLLVTGCEVSLWVGEQFASDLHRAFPKLKILTISANKLLGQLGQGFPIPQTGFNFHEGSYDLSESCVLLLSHSGGTFATLNVSNLLKGFTSNLFVVTSEWDTQAARAVRTGKPGLGPAPSWHFESYVFTTFTGCRPAEPCSVSVAATHQVLTQILLYLMYAARWYEPGKPQLCGSSFREEEVRELERLNANTIANLRQLGDAADPTRRQLLAQGARWAQHVLEGPIAWILSFAYIVATVVSGYTPLSAIVLAIEYAVSGSWGYEGASCGGEIDPHASYVVRAVDALLYAFLPIWTTWLIRLVQGRPWLHRVSGRSILIGDVPWVAQSIEAYVSKLFALSYSIASVSVASANPLDHLVHRHTHRVVRGGLLAVGRPDGRLNALASAENTVCLSVSQASSIQNMGVTLESFTLGHNPHQIGLSAGAVFLPTTRPKFLSEWVLREKIGRKQSVSASTMMGLLTGIERAALPKGVASGKKAGGKDCGPASAPAAARALARSPTTARRVSFSSGDGAESGTQRRPVFKHIVPLEGAFVGEWMLTADELRGASNTTLMAQQATVQALYEGRFASLERFVGFLILFHRMAKAVQDFWPAVSCRLLGYDMSRTQSIMRIATTASPVSGAEVRFKMLELEEETRQLTAVRLMQAKFRNAMRHLKTSRTQSEIDQLKMQLELAKKVSLKQLDEQVNSLKHVAPTPLTEDHLSQTSRRSRVHRATVG